MGIPQSLGELEWNILYNGWFRGTPILGHLHFSSMFEYFWDDDDSQIVQPEWLWDIFVIFQRGSAKKHQVRSWKSSRQWLTSQRLATRRLTLRLSWTSWAARTSRVLPGPLNARCAWAACRWPWWLRSVAYWNVGKIVSDAELQLARIHCWLFDDFSDY